MTGTAPRPELTVRAIATGMAIGAILTPCNVYSGLKIGWSFNMSIAAGLLGFGFWRLGESVFGTRPWGMFENNINQTAASSSASIVSGGLVAPVPALAMLTGQTLPWGLLAIWVFAVSILGVIVAAGLRNQMLLREKLPFPAGVATAETLREIHARGREAALRLRFLAAAGLVSGGLKLIDGAWSLPRFALPAALGVRAAGATPANLGFVLDPSLLMIGFGAIIGLRAGLSLLAGAAIAWGVLAPWLLARGWAEPGPEDPGASWFATLVEWLLWPGVTMMVVAALVAFAVSVGRLVLKRNESNAGADKESPTLPRNAFVAGLAATLVLAVAAQAGLFGIGLFEAVLAVLLSFVLAVVAARVSGETGITPIGAMGKITQFTFGIVSPGNLTDNLMSANVTGGAAGQAADMLHDLRTGAIVGASPRFQIVAQVFGVLTGSLVGSLVYLLLIPDPANMLITPEWPAPAVAVWKAVAEVMAKGLGSLPQGSGVAMVLAGAFGLSAVAGRIALPEKYARYIPSAPAMGLAFVIPAWNSISLCLGALAAAVLFRIAPDWSRRRLIVIAAGLVAGESLVGVALSAVDLLG